MKSRWNSSTKKKYCKKRLLLRLSFEKKAFLCSLDMRRWFHSFSWSPTKVKWLVLTSSVSDFLTPEHFVVMNSWHRLWTTHTHIWHWYPCLPRPQMKSLQCEQKVGCRKKVAMNLCELTWWTRRFIAPRRCFSAKPPSRSLNWRIGCDCSSWDAHCSSIFTCKRPWGSKSVWKIKSPMVNHGPITLFGRWGM